LENQAQVRSYKDLDVWQVAMDLVEACYRITAKFPRDELYGLTSQMRRSAVSIPANIAEGYGRELTGSYIQFLRIAQGSVKELETHTLISQRVKLCADDDVTTLLALNDRVGRMLRNLIRSLENRREDASH
jgi:four helix bundle protein